MDLDLTRETLSIEGGTDEDFGQLEWSSTLDFNQNVLLDDVRHLFLLLLTLVNVLFEIGDLPGDRVKAMLVS